MTDQPKWTPAPWALEIRSGSGDAADCTIAMIEPADQRAPYRGMIARLQSAEHIDGIAAGELLANANLLFAAPDLYAALAGLLADIQDYQRINNLGGEDNHWQVISLAALAKARGQA